MVLEGHGAHAGLSRIDGYINHVLGTMHEVGIGVDMVIDCSHQQLVLDTRMDFENLRVVLEHLVEVVLSVELANASHVEDTPDHDLLDGKRDRRLPIANAFRSY